LCIVCGSGVSPEDKSTFHRWDAGTATQRLTAHDIILDIMAALLKWKEPHAVADYELKHEGIPEFKNLFRISAKWSFLLALIVLPSTWYWLREGFFPALFVLLLCSTALPAFFVAQVWLGYKLGVQCSIHKKGIMRAFGNKARLYFWKEIESYRFVDYPHVLNVRDLIITLHQKNRRFERNFRFDPHEINEQQLAELLREYLFNNHGTDA